MRLNINNGEYYLLNGPSTVKVESGSIEVIGAKTAAGECINVPVGKKVPLIGLDEAVLEITAREGALTKLEASSIPEEWGELANKIAAEKKPNELYKIIVLGEVDTGKTFFSTYLANKLIEKSLKTAVLDCDAGQSDIGCPGTFGMLLLKKPAVFLTELEPTFMYYIGAHSSALHFAPTLSGLDYMLNKARQTADALIIDTTGWVQGDGGRAIKKAKLDMVRPDKVILMQRSNELEHLVKHLDANKIVRLPVSKKASSTSQMDRKELRELVSRKFFKDAKVIEIGFDKLFTDRCYFRTGAKIELEGTLYAEKLSGFEGVLVFTSDVLMPEMTKNWPKDLGNIKNVIAGSEKGLEAALLDGEQNMLAIARVEQFDFLLNRFRLRTSYKGDINNIKGIQFGSLKITEEGNENGFIEGGSF